MRLRTCDAQLLAKNAVAREVALDPCARGLLGAPVCNRHRGAIGLRFDHESGLVIAERDIAGDAGYLLDGHDERFRRFG